MLVPFFGLIVCSVVCARFRQEQFSLRLGHTRALTSHCDVIHYARAASLPLPYKGCAFLVCSAVGVCCGRSKPLPYWNCAFFLCIAVCVCCGTVKTVPYGVAHCFVGDGLARPVFRACHLCGGMRLFRTRNARPYRVCAFFVGDEANTFPLYPTLPFFKSFEGCGELFQKFPTKTASPLFLCLFKGAGVVDENGKEAEGVGEGLFVHTQLGSKLGAAGV